MPTPYGAHPHHLFTRGAGRLDVPINLMSLCHECHRKFHDGNVDRQTLVEIVAMRELMTADELVDEIYRLRRMLKKWKGDNNT